MRSTLECQAHYKQVTHGYKAPQLKLNLATENRHTVAYVHNTGFTAVNSDNAIFTSLW